jgi:hypothetical protein
MLGINDEIINDIEYSDVGDNINGVRVNDTTQHNTTNNTNDDILNLQIRFNTNLDDIDDDDSKYNNEDNDETPIHLNMRR